MIEAISPFVLKPSLFLVTAVGTHLMMSFGQTLIHYKVAHHPIGGKIYHNHLNFHHTHYSDDHLVSGTYLGDEGNTTPYFFIPVLLAQYFCGNGSGMYWIVLCACLFRQGIPLGEIAASAVCMVQTQTRAAFRSSPACGQ
jgi:hypothetical protein